VISEMTPPPHSLPEMADERSKTAPGVPCPARRGRDGILAAEMEWDVGTCSSLSSGAFWPGPNR
jgi:hypothetical protein